MAESRWYVVNTHPNCEGRAETHLRRQGFTAYLPKYMRKRRHARREDMVSRPLFPRYVFVALDLAKDRWRSVNSTFGVSRLVSAGEAPLPVSDAVIDEIRCREGDNGFVRLGLPAGVGLGSPIRLIDGIFSEYEGVIDRIADDQRVAVLLKLLGREVRVFVSSASVGTV